MKRIWLEKDGTLQVLTDENLDDVKRVLVTQKGSLYGCLFYSDELRPKGEWLLGEWDGYADGNPVAETLICSECDFEIAAINESDFCPNCGSKMKHNGGT